MIGHRQPRSACPVLTGIGLPAATFSIRRKRAGQGALRAQTDLARQRGIFGVPTFFVGPEMFWGNDRLDDAMLVAAGGKSESADATG